MLCVSVLRFFFGVVQVPVVFSMFHITDVEEQFREVSCNYLLVIFIFEIKLK